MTPHHDTETARRPARRTTLGRTAIAALAVAGVIAGSACSDSEGDVGGENAGGGDGGDFCADFEALNDSLSTAESADFDTIVDGLESLDAPQEISDDFDTMIDAARQLADLDPADPAQVEDAQAVQEESQDAQQNVSSYLEDECGLDLSTSGAEGVDPGATAPGG